MTEAGEEHSGPITTLLAGIINDWTGCYVRPPPLRIRLIRRPTTDFGQDCSGTSAWKKSCCCLPCSAGVAGTRCRWRRSFDSTMAPWRPCSCPLRRLRFWRRFAESSRITIGWKKAPRGFMPSAIDYRLRRWNPAGCPAGAPLPIVMRHSDSPAVMKTLDGALARAGYRLDTPSAPEVGEPR